MDGTAGMSQRKIPTTMDYMEFWQRTHVLHARSNSHVSEAQTCDICGRYCINSVCTYIYIYI